MRIPKIYARKSTASDKIRTVDLNKAILLPVEYIPDVDFDDSKSIEKYTKTVKSIVRGSPSYKNLMSFLKNKVELNGCFFMPKIKKYKGSKISIQMHHTGLVMEDIIKTVLFKRHDEDESIDTQSVADEVMINHYKGKIGLTSLCATAHKLIHIEDSNLFIPLQFVDFGDMNIFFDEYKDYIKAHMPELYKNFESYKILSDTVTDIKDIIPEYMDLDISYLTIGGNKIPQLTMEEIDKIVNDKLD